MSSKTRFHRPTPKSEPQKRLLHPCGFCFHGGGTLRKAIKEEQLKVWKEKKIPILYVHTEPRFCKEYHIPKRFFLAANQQDRLQERREKQIFHVRGFIPRQNSQPRKMV